MGFETADELIGLEFDWLAGDADGHVALFSTAGGGHIPRAALRDTDALADAIKAILALPPSTVATFAPEVGPGCENTWRLVAERGLFAFDSSFNGGPYGMVAAPAVPARLEDLPAAVVDALRGLEFDHIRFAGSASISSSMLEQHPGREGTE